MHSKGVDCFEIIPLELANTSLAGLFLFTIVTGCMHTIYATGADYWFTENVPGGGVVVVMVMLWTFMFIPLWRLMGSLKRHGRPRVRFVSQ